MAEPIRPDDSAFLKETSKLPEMINVLTILTFIGSGLLALFACWEFVGAKASLDMVTSGNMPAIARNFMPENYVEKLTFAYQNRVPILLMNLLVCALCIYGAILMRRLKKNGFVVYCIGELLLPLGTAYIFLGPHVISGGRDLFSLFFGVLFIVLYATQLKYLR
jgi:hypothetical protein